MPVDLSRAHGYLYLVGQGRVSLENGNKKALGKPGCEVEADIEGNSDVVYEGELATGKPGVPKSRTDQSLRRLIQQSERLSPWAVVRKRERIVFPSLSKE